MTIANYGELQTQLNTYLFHQRFVAQYDNATLKFERVANRKLRVPPQQVSVPLTTVAGSVSLPADYILWRSVIYKGISPFIPLDYIHPTYLETSKALFGLVRPKVFTIEGNALKVRPVSDVANIYEFHYFQKLPTLITNDSNFNWLLTEFPDVYEYGVLVELYKLARNKEQAELYKAHRDEVFQEVREHYAGDVDPSSPLVRTADYY